MQTVIETESQPSQRKGDLIRVDIGDDAWEQLLNTLKDWGYEGCEMGGV